MSVAGLVVPPVGHMMVVQEQLATRTMSDSNKQIVVEIRGIMRPSDRSTQAVVRPKAKILHLRDVRIPDDHTPFPVD